MFKPPYLTRTILGFILVVIGLLLLWHCFAIPRSETIMGSIRTATEFLLSLTFAAIFSISGLSILSENYTVSKTDKLPKKDSDTPAV